MYMYGVKSYHRNKPSIVPPVWNLNVLPNLGWDYNGMHFDTEENNVQ